MNKFNNQNTVVCQHTVLGPHDTNKYCMFMTLLQKITQIKFRLLQHQTVHCITLYSCNSPLILNSAIYQADLFARFELTECVMCNLHKFEAK